MRSFILLFAAVALTACGETAGVGGPSEGGIDSGRVDSGRAVDSGRDIDMDSGHAHDASSIPDGGSCGSSVTFRMQTTSPSDYWVNIGIPTFNKSWYSIATADGAPVKAFLVGSCIYCDSCIASSCGLASPIYVPVPTDGGITGLWNGSAYTSFSTCGSPNGLACAVSSCMPAGKYVVTMCALADSSSPNDDPILDAGAGTCIEVPFQYPAA